MRSIQLTNRVFWVGVKDPNLKVFDIIVKIDYGTTYNSYLVRGEKTALIDAVKSGFEKEFFSNIEEHIAVDDVDYLIVNHTEPDHSGAFRSLLDRNPKLKLICSKAALPFLRNVINDESRMIDGVSAGNVLDLGGITLQFISAPFLHWPDTMFTYCFEDKILFPCDAYGAHYSPDDDIFYQRGNAVFEHQVRYYYDSIMRPYAPYCRKATEAAMKLDIDIVAPSHGLINCTEPKKFMQKYLEWTSRNSSLDRPLVIIIYASAYGNTKKMAEEINSYLLSQGVATKVMNVAASSTAELRDLLEIADGILFGSPTFVGDAVKPIWEALNLLPTIAATGKKAAAFGSYGWGGQAVEIIEDYLEGLKLKVHKPGAKARLVPSEAELNSCRDFAAGFARFVKE